MMATYKEYKIIRHQAAPLKAWKTRKRRAAALKAWDTRRKNESQWLRDLLPLTSRPKPKPHRINTTTRRIVLED